MKLRVVPILMLSILVSCTSLPSSTSPPPLAAVTVASIRDNIGSGSPFSALQDISTLKRTDSQVPETEISRLYSDAVSAMGDLFQKAVADSEYGRALSIFHSASVLDVAGKLAPWTVDGLELERAKRYLKDDNPLVRAVMHIEEYLTGTSTLDLVFTFDGPRPWPQAISPARGR